MSGTQCGIGRPRLMNLVLPIIVGSSFLGVAATCEIRGDLIALFIGHGEPGRIGTMEPRVAPGVRAQIKP
jgi:hypothetical protein